MLEFSHSLKLKCVTDKVLFQQGVVSWQLFSPQQSAKKLPFHWQFQGFWITSGLFHLLIDIASFHRACFWRQKYFKIWRFSTAGFPFPVYLLSQGNLATKNILKKLVAAVCLKWKWSLRTTVSGRNVACYDKAISVWYLEKLR